jgi:general secretion pathway protein B
MSLILDALKRAEAERLRGRAPELLAQQAGPAASTLGRAGGAAAVPAWVVLAALLLLLATLLLLGWLVLRAPQRLPAAVAPVAVPAVQPPGSGTTPGLPQGGGATAGLYAASAVAAGPLPAEVVRAPAVAPAAAPARMAAAASAAASAAARVEASGSAPNAVPPASTPGDAGSSAAPSPRSPPSSSSAVAAPVQPLPSWAELPASLRQQLPPLVASGSVYAERPAERMVILNGAVWREQDSPAPGLTVESIGLRQVVLNFRGTRFMLPL